MRPAHIMLYAGRHLFLKKNRLLREKECAADWVGLSVMRGRLPVRRTYAATVSVMRRCFAIVSLFDFRRSFAFAFLFDFRRSFAFAFLFDFRRSFAFALLFKFRRIFRCVFFSLRHDGRSVTAELRMHRRRLRRDEFRIIHRMPAAVSHFHRFSGTNQTIHIRMRRLRRPSRSDSRRHRNGQCQQ